MNHFRIIQNLNESWIEEHIFVFLQKNLYICEGIHSHCVNFNRNSLCILLNNVQYFRKWEEKTQHSNVQEILLTFVLLLIWMWWENLLRTYKILKKKIYFFLFHLYVCVCLRMNMCAQSTKTSLISAWMSSFEYLSFIKKNTHDCVFMYCSIRKKCVVCERCLTKGFLFVKRDKFELITCSWLRLKVSHKKKHNLCSNIKEKSN